MFLILNKTSNHIRSNNQKLKSIFDHKFKLTPKSKVKTEVKMNVCYRTTFD